MSELEKITIETSLQKLNEVELTLLQNTSQRYDSVIIGKEDQVILYKKIDEIKNILNALKNNL